MFTRRHFLNTCATGAAVSLAGPVPSTFAQIAGERSRRAPDEILVVLFLAGGNDGLNTVIPAKDPLYQKYRNYTQIDAASGLGIGNDLFLHPNLNGLADVWENDRLAIIQAAGYPNHNRSHFVSTAVWHSGNTSARPEEGLGWLGLGFDRQQQSMDSPVACSVGTNATPHILRGRYTRTASPIELKSSEAVDVQQLLSRQSGGATSDAALVSARRNDAVDSVKQLLNARRSSNGLFPNSRLGRQFQRISWLIDSGGKASVYFVMQSGYDTHATQSPTHAGLLQELGSAVSAFDHWAQESGNGNRVTTMIFSEFGRRLEDNASGGTDHGKGGPVFVFGGNVRPGFHGATPNLEDADDGDVRVTTDFRSIYKAIQQRLNNFNDTFGNEIEPLSLFKV